MNPMESYNYYMDNRVLASTVIKPNFDEKKMVLMILFFEDDLEVEYTFPAKYHVCSLCNGKGKHTNPSIDASGLTHEDFCEDPDFYTNYKNGAYDQICNQCGGERVIPVIDETRCSTEEKKNLKKYYDYLKDEYDYARECAMERAMGA